jgi:hypothetical protein
LKRDPNKDMVPRQQKQEVPGLGLKTTAIQNVGWPTGIKPFPIPQIHSTVDGPVSDPVRPDYRNPNKVDFIFESHTNGKR